MLVKLKKDYVVPAGTEMQVYSSQGPIRTAQAVRHIQVGEMEAVTNFDMKYVADNPEMFEVIMEKFDPTLDHLLSLECTAKEFETPEDLLEKFKEELKELEVT